MDIIVKEIELESLISVPIEKISKKERHKYIYSKIKEEENKCSQKWGFIKDIKKITKICSPKIDILNFTSNIVYKVKFLANVFLLKKDDVVSVNVLETKQIFLCGIINTPFIFIIDNYEPGIEIGDKIFIKVNDYRNNIEKNMITVIGSKI